MEKFEVLGYLKLIKDYFALRKTPSLTRIKDFVREFYHVDNMPENFYEMFLQKLKSKQVLLSIINQDIYQLISYLKYNSEETEEIKDYLTPQDYFSISKKHIKKLELLLQNMPKDENELSSIISEDLIWKLRRRPIQTNEEYHELAYKLYQVFGFDNASELISNKYGALNYEQLHFLIKNLEPKHYSPEERERVNRYLFGDKKSYNIPIRQMLNGRILPLFLNFDYFYNNNQYFVEKLGRKLPLDKLRLLLEERYLTSEPTTPEITAELREDMLSSYYHKYTETDTKPDIVIDKNIGLYTEKLRNKYASSIPQITIQTDDEEIKPELLNLSDPRNLTHGYRSGNCFRVNGDAAILFSKFLDSEHMRILSFSTAEYKDYAMVLLMRNGNVLIAQGIETSKWVPPELKGKRLYDLTSNTLKQVMDYMNSCGDEVVGTIIGATNENVTSYNNNILPFIVSPNIENSSNYYNGVSTYQCLLDLAPSKTIHDMKAYIPEKRYYDQREAILSRKNNYPVQDIERRIISLRYQRTKTQEGYTFYEQMLNKHEQETICNKDWYITLFTDGTVDSFLSDTKDPRAKEEYQTQLARVYQKK